MKALTLGSMFLPDAAIPLLLVVAGLMLIVGLRRLAGGLAMLAIICAILPAFEPLLDATLAGLPAWVSWLLLVGMVVTILSAIGLGRFATIMLAHTFGILLADTIRFFWLLPFRGVGLVFRLFRRRP